MQLYNAIFGMRFSCKSSPSIRYFAHFLLFTETRLAFENHFAAVNIMIKIISRPELGKDILGLQPHDKAAMVVVTASRIIS